MSCFVDRWVTVAARADGCLICGCGVFVAGGRRKQEGASFLFYYSPSNASGVFKIILSPIPNLKMT